MIEQVFKDGESCGFVNCMSPLGCPKCERTCAEGIVKFIDGGLVQDISKDKQVEEFYEGLKDGVSFGKNIKIEYHYFYRRGYAKGQKFFREAITEFREEIVNRLTTEIGD